MHTNRPKIVATALLAALIILSTSLSQMHFGSAQTGTLVGAVISSETTWTQANSPYILTTFTTVNSGVTLTVGPGVTIEIGKYNYLLINGVLNAVGTSADPINVTGGEPFYAWTNPFSPPVPEGITLNGTGSIIENADINSYLSIYDSSQITDTYGTTFLVTSGSPDISDNSQVAVYEYGGAATITDNTVTGGVNSGFIVYQGSPAINNNTIDGGISVYGGSPTITDNTITGSALAGIGLGVAAVLDQTDVTVVSNNSVSGNFNFCVFASGDATIQQNLLQSNASNAVGIEAVGPQSDVTVQDNAIIGVPTGIFLSDSLQQLNFAYNNLVDNSQNSLYCNLYSNVDAAFNWWGTADTAQINQSIYDSKYNPTLGTVSFVPFLTDPNTDAPATPTQSPSPTPNLPTPTPTLNPISTPSSSPSPTSSQTSPTPTLTPTPTPTPSPSIPEFPAWAIPSIFLVTAFAAVALARKKKQTGRRL